jgi:hypothetical protein
VEAGVFVPRSRGESEHTVKRGRKERLYAMNRWMVFLPDKRHAHGGAHDGYTVALLVSLLWMTGFVVVSAVVFRHQDVNA